jgi:hypothetical protein
MCSPFYSHFALLHYMSRTNTNFSFLEQLSPLQPYVTLNVHSVPILNQYYFRQGSEYMYISSKNLKVPHLNRNTNTVLENNVD